MSTSDIIYLICFVVFCFAFITAASIFLLKKGRERKKEILQAVNELQSELAEAENEAIKEEPKPEQPVDLSKSLIKTRTGFWGKLSRAFEGNATEHEALIGAIEPILFASDVGFKSADELLQKVRVFLKNKPEATLEDLKDLLKQEIKSMLTIEARATLENKPHVILFVGVNGVGKTTTIGKLAAQYTSKGKSVMVGAGDTFRAAAAEQLNIWAERSGASIVKGNEGSDPASVLFDAVKVAKENGVDLVLGDSAGRLHNKTDLMDELKKITKVMAKACPGAPHEVYLVLDATTGQNGLAQAKEFMAAANVSGVVLTKLDGTAKGGIAIAICHEFGLPIKYIGVGEGVEDLRPFEAEIFVDAIFN